MGNTLEGQQALAPKPKKQKPKITVTPDEPYYSSEELRSGYRQTLPAAVSSAQFRQGPLGNLSPRAAIQDTVSKGMDLFRGEEGQVGSRLARLAAEEIVTKHDGGIAKKTKVY
tara:strand:+ start:415 stop:753 length:339 start_codon:yes stop_codon:yes gene_type:complete